MKVLSVVGARPQFVKLAPVAAALTAAGHEHVIVHTGQHYDARMSDVFFADLSIPDPTVHLGVGSASHGVQTGAMLSAMDAVLDEHQPDWVLVYGDTNSTLAGALCAVKQHVPVAHLEAGLRSFNRRMPEEHNRVLTDHAADLLLAPTAVAMVHLANEGLADKSVLVGDVMTDVLFLTRDAVKGDPAPLPSGLSDSGYLLSTVHRAENTDDPARLRMIVEGLAALPLPVVLLAHPRLVAKAAVAGVDLEQGSLHALEPLNYPGMVAAVLKANGVVTDSGGLQKEAYLLGTPCTTLRTETEWPETLEGGWNVLSADLTGLGDIVVRPRPTTPTGAPYG
ncbi:MAG: UDP-N-acetylglucosamine 2-epimerase (non-hydrolyzing), partial [Actinomycetota bacterium]|nr:UDP-N-acetylglucosamine 2-epimerase (non-hydrolyzing) [Actinomycetota bacterium]